MVAPVTPVTVVFNIFASVYESHEAGKIVEHAPQVLAAF